MPQCNDVPAKQNNLFSMEFFKANEEKQKKHKFQMSSQKKMQCETDNNNGNERRRSKEKEVKKLNTQIVSYVA